MRFEKEAVFCFHILEKRALGMGSKDMDAFMEIEEKLF